MVTLAQASSRAVALAPWLGAAAMGALLVFWLVVRPLRFKRRFREQGIGGLPFRPVVGNIPELRRALSSTESSETFFAEAFSRFGDNFTSQLGTEPRLVTRDPELCTEVLVRQAKIFTKPEMMRRILSPILGNGLVTSEGELHKRQRALMSPAFHFSKLKEMIPIMVQHTDATLRNLWGAAGGPSQTRDVHEDMMQVTLSIITSCAVGMPLQGRPDVAQQVAAAVTAALDLALERVQNIIGIVPVLSQLPVRSYRELAKVKHVLDTLAMSLVQDRKEGRSRSMLDGKPDLMDLLLSAHAPEGGGGMSIEQLKDELVTLLGAGHETTGNLMSWALYELMQHPEILARCRDEVRQHLGDAAPDYENMKNLKLCEAVILETLRHHSPVAHVVRCAQADAELQLRGGKTLHIQQGDTILLSMFGLHHHPDLWPEPNKFMPERFLGRDAGGEGDASAQAGGRGGIANSFIPFVLGPRSCIGQVFARLEAKVILVRILQGYRLDLVPGQKILPQFRVTNRPRFGVKAVVAPL